MKAKIRKFIEKRRTLTIISLFALIFLFSLSLFLILNPNSKTDILYGVNIHRYYDNTTMQNLNLLGAETVRIDFSWSGDEKLYGIYDFSAEDKIIDTHVKAGIEPLAILAYGNSLYITTPDDIKNYNSDPSNRWKVQYIPNNQEEFERFKEAYGNYVYEVVKHFKGRVKYFEIWNEPYVQSFWYPTINPVLFTELLKEAYTRAKEANPDVIILNSGVTDLNFMQTMYTYGAKGYFDIQSFHPYCYPYDPMNYTSCAGMNNIFKLKEMMKQYGDESPIWITEMGYPAVWCDSKGANCDSRVSLEGQATYLNRTIQAIKKDMPYVQAFFWYQFQDGSGCSPTDGWNECNFGLISGNQTKKPAFYTYKSIIEG